MTQIFHRAEKCWGTAVLNAKRISGLAFWNAQNVRKVIRTCPNIDFPRDHMHGVNISNHTWGQALRNEARITENIALYYHVFVLRIALNNNDVQPSSTLTAAQFSIHLTADNDSSFWLVCSKDCKAKDYSREDGYAWEISTTQFCLCG